MKKVTLYICLSILFIASAVSAVDYKEFKVKKKHKDYFEVVYSRHNNEFRVVSISNNTVSVVTGDNNNLQIKNNQVSSKGKVIFDNKNISINHLDLSIDNITDCKISEDDDFITISFYTAKDDSKLARFKKGNRISSDEDIFVSHNDFVRGIIFSISGDITIKGEVNKDVISLFGNINIVDDGVVRGDLATINGKIDIESSANVYGEIYDRNEKGRGLKHRRYRDRDDFNYDPYFSYNRVDGAAISLKAYHNDIDSILPTLEAEIGIAFASDRGRYKFLIEQTLFREKSIGVGGTFYRELASEDDWLISKDENTFFALMAKEDYKDYYEAEGGTLYMKAMPSKHFSLKAGYSYFETNWLPSNRHLWALLRGADKLFDKNYQSWYATNRLAAISEVDTSSVGSLFGSLHYYSDTTFSETEKSNWHIFTDFEFSQSGLNSDFDYHRYLVTIRRYQEINDQSSFTFRSMFGNSDGYLPAFKKFYLGGLSSLHGYSHKEFSGNRFWMTNSEYRIDFPKSEFGLSLFWDMGQIANNKLDSEIEIKQSIGVSIFFEDDFTLTVAKRLDRSTNDSPKLYLRFNQTF